MNYRLMFILNAIVAFVFGAAFLIMPGTTLDQFGAEGRVPELLLARFFGSGLVTIGLLVWFAKDAAEAAVQKNLAIALLAGSILGLIVTVLGISPASGVIRSNGWIAILIYLLFCLGYGYLLYLKPRMKE